LRKYPRFKEEFLTHIKPLYKPSEKAFVLRSYLSDEIKEEVEGLGEDTERIWKRLDKKYGDKGKLVDGIMSEIKKLGKSVDRDHREHTLLLNRMRVNKRIKRTNSLPLSVVLYTRTYCREKPLLTSTA